MRFVITAFDGTTIVTANRDMIWMSDTRPVISRIGYLENGAKFDADGTADSDRALGQVEAWYMCVASGTGMGSLHTEIEALVALRGKEGTLTAVRRISPSDTTVTCTARCTEAQTDEYDISVGPPLTATNRQWAIVKMKWEKKTEFA